MSEGNPSNRIQAEVGFTVNNSSENATELKTNMGAINNMFAEFANKLKAIETKINSLGTTAVSTSNNISKESKKASSERITELNKELSSFKNNLKQELDNVRKNNALEIEEQKQTTIKLRTLEEEKRLAAKEESTKRLAEIRNDAYQERLVAKETQRQIAAANKEQERQAREIAKAQTAYEISQYQERLQNFKSLVSQIKSETNSISSITSAGTTLNSENLNGTFSAAVGRAALQVTGIRAVINQFANVSSEIIEIEKNVINIQRIMNDNSEELSNSLLNNAIETAKATGTQVTDVQEIQSAWVRVNEAYSENLDLLNQITEASAKFMNVGEIEDAEDAVALVNSAMLQFGMTSTDVWGNTTVDIDEAISTLNKWAYMADKTALGTADEFGEAVSDFGGQIVSLGGSMDDAIVMTSILGDRLAKTGSEAGKALKTFTSYLNRDKTINLFKQLSLDSQGLYDDLMKTSTQYEEFIVLMNHVSEAYNTAIEKGDAVTAKSIQNALGATRQGDTAITLLKNWSSDYEKYMGMINEANSTDYLSEQNSKMLEAFSAQWNQLKTSITEFATALFNSGINDTLQKLMDIVGGFLDVLSNASPAVKETTVAFLEVVTVMQTLKLLDKKVGLLNSFAAGFKYGTVAAREEAEVVAKNTANLISNNLERAKSKKQSLEYVTGTKQAKAAIDSEIASLEAESAQFLELEKQYKAGKINAQQFTAKVNELSVAKTANTTAQNANTVSTQANTTANTANASSSSTNTAATLKETIAIKAKSAAQRIANGISSAGSAILNSLKSPAVIATLAITGLTYAWKALSEAFPSAEKQIEKAKEKLDETTEELEDVNSQLETAKNRIEEINSQDTITVTDQADLDRLNQEVELLEKKQELLEKQKEQETQEYNNKIQKALGKSSVDFDNRTTTPYATQYGEGEIEVISTNSAAFDTSAILKFMVEIDNLKEKLKGLDEGTQEYEETSGQLASLQSTLADVMANVETAFGGADADISSMDATTLALYESFLRLKSIFDGMDGDTPVLSLEVDEALSDDVVQKDINSLKELANQGQLTKDKLMEYSAFQDLLDSGVITVDELITEIANYGDKVSNIDYETFDLTDLTSDAEQLKNTVSGIDDDIMKLYKGNYDNSDILQMTQDYEGFSEVANGTVAEQIAWLQQYKATSHQTFADSLTDAENTLNQQKASFLNALREIATYSSETGSWVPNSTEDADKVQQLTNAIAECENKLQDVSDYSYIKFDFDMGDAVSNINTMITSVKDLVSAQEQLASGTALSKQELWELAQTYPELMSVAGLFADSTVEQQQAAISSVLDMKNQEKDATIDGMITELEAKAEQLTQQITMEQEQADLAATISANLGTERINQNSEVNDQINRFFENEATNQANAMETEVKNSDTSSQQQSDNTENLINSMSEDWNTLGDNMAYSTGAGAETGISNVGTLATSSGATLGTLSNTFSTIAKAVANMFNGSFTGIANNTKKSLVGSISKKAGLNGYTEASGSYSGSSVYNKSNWSAVAAQKSEIVNNLKSQLKSITAQIGNLKAFKEVDLTGLNNTYNGSSSSGSSSGSSGSGGSGSSGSGSGSGSGSKSSSSSSGSSKIDSYISEYESNIKSMQDRIVKALKQKYQDLYDERKKQLEEIRDAQIKVHNDRIEQLQAEIDKLNGDTTEDKKEQLKGLQNSYQEWLSDDSSFGKSRQKALLSQIEDLEKEIKIDELETQIEDEQTAIDNIEDYFSQLFDSDSPLYDPTLKALDEKMTNASLYTEANDLIKNQKTQEIIDLLTKYDENFDGMAMLMGKTAGQIIAEDVKEALANYLDVIQNTFTENGGTHTLGISSSSATTRSSSLSSSSGSSSSSSGIPFISKKDSTSKSKLDINGSIVDRLKYNNFDSSYSAREKLYNYWGAAYGAYTGSGKQNNWLLSKMKQAGYSTGTYTGNSEGIAYLHKKERVLNAEQTKAFESLVYDFLPTISKELTGGNLLQNAVSNDNSVTFEKEVMSVHVDQIVNNTPYDIKNTEDNMNRMFKKAIKKSGVNIKL